MNNDIIQLEDEIIELARMVSKSNNESELWNNIPYTK